MTSRPPTETRPGLPVGAESSLADLSDEELIAESRRSGEASGRCLEMLFERSYAKVARWCLRISGNRDVAADIAQDVFTRVHERLDTFRLESRFSTWLYVVTRSVAINKIQSNQRRLEALPEASPLVEPRDPTPSALRRAAAKEDARTLRRAMEDHLDELEAKVLYLHFVEGLTLPAITTLLGLTNKSGSKAYIVAAKRKLKRALAETLPTPRLLAGG